MCTLPFPGLTVALPVAINVVITCIYIYTNKREMSRRSGRNKGAGRADGREQAMGPPGQRLRSWVASTRSPSRRPTSSWARYWRRASSQGPPAAGRAHPLRARAGRGLRAVAHDRAPRHLPAHRRRPAPQRAGARHLRHQPAHRGGPLLHPRLPRGDAGPGGRLPRAPAGGQAGPGGEGARGRSWASSGASGSSTWSGCWRATASPWSSTGSTCSTTTPSRCWRRSWGTRPSRRSSPSSRSTRRSAPT